MPHIEYRMELTKVEHKSQFELMTDNLIGKLCVVYWKLFEENWPCYNSTVSYMVDIAIYLSGISWVSVNAALILRWHGSL